MIKNRKLIILIFIAITLFISIRLVMSNRQNKPEKTAIINPDMGDVSISLTTTGLVEPQNRLEIKPSIGGRIDDVLVKEGDQVKTGEALLWMSSSERAALIDTARSQGEEVLKYWEEVYRKTPIISPIDGEVIVRAVEPGQTVTTADAILVLSNRLIIAAQFDETDIGAIKVGQQALITLDAYPHVIIEGIVNHIAYESEIINNVTIYEVDIVPKEVPPVMRSGMSVTVEVIEKTVQGVLTIPSGAIHYDGEREFVLLEGPNGKIIEKDISTGINNGNMAEVVSGLSQDAKIIVKNGSYLPKRKSIGSNPFMPSRNRK